MKFTYNFSDLLFCNVYKLCQFLKKKSGFFLDFNKLFMAFLYFCRPAVSSSTRSLIGVFGSSLSNSFSSWKKNGIFNHTFNKTCNINHSAVRVWNELFIAFVKAFWCFIHKIFYASQFYLFILVLETFYSYATSAIFVFFNIFLQYLTRWMSYFARLVFEVKILKELDLFKINLTLKFSEKHFMKFAVESHITYQI